VTLGVVGVVLALGLVAAVCEAVGPPLGSEVAGPGGEPVRQRMLDLKIEAAQLSALNPLFVMIVIPALNLLVYGPLRARGIEIKPLQRMTAGMFLAAGAFAAAAVLQGAIQTSGLGQVHALWQVIPYFIMTVAEVLVSITGLEFAYTQAPRAMKSTIMSFWLLCVTFGNLLVAFLAPLQKTVTLSSFFWLFAALMVGAAAIFLVLASFYRGKTYLQHAAKS
jgi:POT family proton-dependent oligopeptide transporter